MAGPADLEARVAALETHVGDLDQRVRRSEQDAAAARVLAGAADRDVGEIRTEIREFRQQNNRVLNAMREDLTDLRSHVDGEFTSVREELASLRSHVDDGFLEIRGKLDATGGGVQQIAAMLNTLIQREDQ